MMSEFTTDSIIMLASLGEIFGPPLTIIVIVNIVMLVFEKKTSAHD
jgi:hypothetical protein